MKYVQYAFGNAYITWNRQKVLFSMCERKKLRVEKQVENAVSKRSLTSSKCHHTHWPVVHHWSKGGWANKGSLQTVKKFISREVMIFWKFQRLGALPRSHLLHKHGAWDLEKLNRYSIQIGKNITYFCYGLQYYYGVPMGLIISIDARTWPIKKIFLFLAPLLMLYCDFENIDRQPIHRQFVSIFSVQLLHNHVWE